MKPHIVPAEPEKMLTAKQRQAALLLASGKTIEQTARDIGVNEKSIDRWKKQVSFKAAMRQAEDDLYNRALSLLRKATGPAVSCLLRNMSKKVTPYVQVQAAGRLLEESLKLNALAEIETRLEELEQLLGKGGRRIL